MSMVCDDSDGIEPLLKLAGRRDAAETTLETVTLALANLSANNPTNCR